VSRELTRLVVVALAALICGAIRSDRGSLASHGVALMSIESQKTEPKHGEQNWFVGLGPTQGEVVCVLSEY
jgi:hypothetical protein